MFKKSHPKKPRRLLSVVLLCSLFCGQAAFAASARVSSDGIWTEEAPVPALKKGVASTTHAKKYKTFGLNLARLKSQLDQSPREFTRSLKESPLVITLPKPDGTFSKFRIEESPVMEPELAAKFSDIKSYRGQGVDDPAASVRLDLTQFGFHAQVLSLNGNYYVDPYGNVDPDYCVSYYKHDLPVPGFECATGIVGAAARGSSGTTTQSQPSIPGITLPPTKSLVSGSTMRTYRLAVACTGEYTAYHSSRAGHTANVADGLAAIVTAVNRIDGIYESELCIHFVLVGNNNQLVFTNPGTDPYSNTSDDTMLTENQSTIDSIIGNGNYDIGHVFSTAGAGLAANGVCQPGIKAQGKTGMTDPIGDAFYVDYVAHEVGHQFGANHTFNCITGGCSGNRSATTAYEPGSASTIMSYAGICGANDLQAHSDPYFSFISLEEIRNYVTPGIGLGDCPPAVNTGNNPPNVTATPHYYLPAGTPFTLTASGSDPDGDNVYYCWEERDLGPSRSLSDPDNGSSPLFRSYYPTADPSRTFPRLAEFGTNTFPGEKLPTVAREMRFRVTARDSRAIGGFATADTSMTIVGSAGPFAVTSPNTSVEWPSGTYQTVQWNVANTDQDPIYCSFVEIYLSTDDGSSYPYQLASVAPNNGSARVFIPVITNASSQCRIKIKAENSIFFDVSDQPFTIPAAVFPTNDNIANAKILNNGAFGIVMGSNVNASKEAGEPAHFYQNPGPAYSGGRSVWYRWSPAQGGPTTLSLGSSELFGVFAVYESGGTNWNGLQLPRLADAYNTNSLTFTANKLKTYYFVVDGLNDQDFGSFQLTWLTDVDSTPPTIGFSPLSNSQTVFDFSQVGGTVSEPSTVTFRVAEFNPGGTDRYWDGSTWTTDGNSLSVHLAASVSGNNWQPVPGTLPPRGQTRYGNYLVYADARDSAGNLGSANLALIRSAPDTTPPVVTLDTIHNGDTFTNRALPGLSGSALDYESGISSVDVFLMRATNPGFAYWTGSAWSSDPATLHASYNSSSVAWQVNDPLPSGSNLPNGNYQVQISAANGEVPAGMKLLSVNFTVDYHPVFVWTAGSYYDTISGNENQNWSNPANWDVGDVPSSDAIVYILSGTPNASTMGSMSVYSLIISNNANLTAPGISIQKKLSLYSGTLNVGAMNIISNAVFEWSGGTLSGNCGILSGASLILTNSADKVLNSASITNNGSIHWYGSGLIQGSYNSVIQNNDLFEADNDSQLYNYTGSSPQPLFNNVGTFRKAGSTNVTLFRQDNGGWAFNNNGVVDIQSGVLSLQSPSFLNNGGSFSGAGLTRIDAGTATMVGNSTIGGGGTVEFAAGSLKGTGTFTGAGTFAWSGGTIAGTNGVGAGTSFAVKGTLAKTLTGTLNNGGNGLWTDQGNINQQAGSTFNNTGTFTMQNDVQCYNTTGSSPQPVFNNSGTLIKSVATGLTDFPNANGGVALNNSGTVQAQSGVISFGGGGTNVNGTFTVDAGARIDFTGGIHYFVSGVQVSGSGVTRLASGTVRLGGGTNSIANAGTFEIAGGTMDGVGGFAGPGTLNWTGGNVSGTLECLSSLNLAISGTGDKTLAGGTINNSGTVVWTGTGTFNGRSGSAFNNFGTFTAQNDALFYNTSGGSPLPVFNNTGILRKAIATGSTSFVNANGGWIFANSGTVDIQTGVLSLQSRATINDGGTFSGAGETRVDGDTTTMSGTNTIANGGTFELAVGSLDGIGTFNGAGTFAWSGGTIRGTNDVAVGANLAINGTNAKTLTGTFSNAGTGFWSGSGNVNCHAGCTFNNSGTFTAQNSASFYNTTGSSPQPVFNNSGTFIKAVGSVTTDFPSANGGVAFNNSGTVNVQSSLLSLAGGGTNANANYVCSLSARVDFSDGSYYFNGNANFSGAGITRIAGATVSLGGGTNTIAAGGTFEMASGMLLGGGNFQGPGVLSWTGGTIRAQLNLLSGATLNLSGSTDKTLGNGGVINNFGNSVWSGSGLFQSENNCVFNNYGVFNIQNDSAFANKTGSSPNPVFNNIGTLRKSVATGTSLFQAIAASWVLTNSGVVDIQSGILSFQYQASFNSGTTISGAGITRIENGNAYFTGTNTVAAGGTLELFGGNFAGTGSFSGPGNVLWTGGTLVGSLSVNSTGNLLLSGNRGKTLSGTLNNAGTATWTGTGNLNLALDSVFNNSGLLLAQNDAQFYNYTGGRKAVFNNSGTLRKNTATGTTTISSANSGVTVTNSGTIDLQSGTLDIQSVYVPTTASQYKVSLGGLTAGTQFGRETFGLPASLDGKLVVSLANGFSPTNGNTFAIASYPSHTGQFSSSQLPTLPNNLLWQLDYGASAVTLKVVQATIITDAARLANGHFQFNLTGPSASSALVQGSTNLIDWVSLSTNAPFTGFLLFDDAQAVNYTNRYYRVLIQP